MTQLIKLFINSPNGNGQNFFYIYLMKFKAFLLCPFYRPCCDKFIFNINEKLLKLIKFEYMPFNQILFFSSLEKKIRYILTRFWHGQNSKCRERDTREGVEAEN